MAYIFKKLNNLTGSAGQSDTTAATGGEVIGGGGGSSGNTQKDPYASTYQNPNKIYQANLNQDMGQVNTGVTKNIADTQNELTKSSDAYKTNLTNVDSKYSYGGQADLEKIGDAGTFSRLSGLINPETGKAELGGVQSKSQYYNPDTAGVAAASTVGGLSNQLKDQYGTSAGGARLDAQIYRGSGQAGKAINQNIGQLNDFQTDKTQRLGAESAMLGQYNQGITDRSNQLKSDGTSYQGNLLNTATEQAKTDQALFDTNRNNAIGGLSSQLNAGTIDAELRKAISEGLAGRQATKEFQSTYLPDVSGALQRAGVEEGAANNLTANYRTEPGNGNSTVDMTDYITNKIASEQGAGASLAGIDASKYVANQKFDANQYIDPRYNQLASLLGSQQMQTGAKLSTNATADDAEFKKAIASQLSGQTNAAKNSAASFFNTEAAAQQGPGDSDFTKIMNALISTSPYGVAKGWGDTIGSVFGW